MYVAASNECDVVDCEAGKRIEVAVKGPNNLRVVNRDIRASQQLLSTFVPVSSL